MYDSEDRLILNGLCGLLWAANVALIIGRVNAPGQAAIAGVVAGLTVALTLDLLDRRGWPSHEQLYTAKLSVFFFGVAVLCPAFIAATDNFAMPF